MSQDTDIVAHNPRPLLKHRQMSGLYFHQHSYAVLPLSTDIYTEIQIPGNSLAGSKEEDASRTLVLSGWCCLRGKSLEGLVQSCVWGPEEDRRADWLRVKVGQTKWTTGNHWTAIQWIKLFGLYKFFKVQLSLAILADRVAFLDVSGKSKSFASQLEIFFKWLALTISLSLKQLNDFACSYFYVN